LEPAVFDHARHRLDFNAAVREQMVSLGHVPEEVVVLRKGLFYYLNLPYFRFVSDFVWSRTAGTVFYDSVLFGVLLFTYPIYLITFSAVVFGIVGIPMVVTMFALPVGFRLLSLRVVNKNQ
jgi:hypothetical protein